MLISGRMFGDGERTRHASFRTEVLRRPSLSGIAQLPTHIGRYGWVTYPARATKRQSCHTPTTRTPRVILRGPFTEQMHMTASITRLEPRWSEYYHEFSDMATDVYPIMRAGLVHTVSPLMFATRPRQRHGMSSRSQNAKL